MALPSLALQLGEVHAPLDVVALRPHDRGLARKFVRAFRFGLLHQLRNGAPGIARLRGIDAVEAEHHRGVQHVAMAVADLVWRAGPGREIAVAGAIDEDVGADRLPSRLGLDEQRVDASVVMHGDAGAERVEEDVDLVRGQADRRRRSCRPRCHRPAQRSCRGSDAACSGRRGDRSAPADRRRCPAPPDASRHGRWHAARRNW